MGLLPAALPLCSVAGISEQHKTDPQCRQYGRSMHDAHCHIAMCSCRIDAGRLYCVPPPPSVYK